MRDIQLLLKQKEHAMEQLRRQVEALRSVTPLLAGANPQMSEPPVSKEARAETSPQLREALRIAAPLLIDKTEEFDPEIRARLIESSEHAHHSRTRTLSYQLKQIAAPLLGSRL